MQVPAGRAWLGDPVVAEAGDATWLGAPFVHLPLPTEDGRKGWCPDTIDFQVSGLGGPQCRVLHLSGAPCQPFYGAARVVRPCKLGFKQYSLRHARLAL